MQVNGVTSALRPTTTACALWDEIWDGRLRRCWTSPAFLETRSLEATICPTRSPASLRREILLGFPSRPAHQPRRYVGPKRSIRIRSSPMPLAVAASVAASENWGDPQI
jgi:hypothetical protein